MDGGEKFSHGTTLSNASKYKTIALWLALSDDSIGSILYKKKRWVFYK